MSIFSNLKINSLRVKIIEEGYELRLERLASGLGNLSQDQRIEIACKIGISIQANSFAKMMIYLSFHPDEGIFKNNIGNLNDLNFNRLYEVMVVWYSWAKIPFGPDGEKNKKRVVIMTDSIKIGLGINPIVMKAYYDGLAENIGLSNLVLYRWCMLAIGHVDIYYETMHGDSPDCRKFVEAIPLALNQAEKSLK